MADLDVRGYLARLGVDGVGSPLLPMLATLHRAHVERVPYTSLDIHLGRPTTVDPLESADRVVRTGRAGYCFHNNGAFAALLAALGYDARWHVAAVQALDVPEPPGRIANHLALTVHGLPAEAAPRGEWRGATRPTSRSRTASCRRHPPPASSGRLWSPAALRRRPSSCGPASCAR